MLQSLKKTQQTHKRKTRNSRLDWCFCLFNCLFISMSHSELYIISKLNVMYYVLYLVCVCRLSMSRPMKSLLLVPLQKQSDETVFCKSIYIFVFPDN